MAHFARLALDPAPLPADNAHMRPSPLLAARAGRPRWQHAVAVVVAATLLALGAVTGTAPARAAACERGTPGEKGEAAVSRLSYPWRDLGYSVEFHPGRTGYLGAAYTGERRIEIYVRDCQTVDSVANVFGHEVGHAVDDVHNDAARRVEWERLRGFVAPWYPCDLCSDYRSGAGDFAEVFAYLKAPRDRFRSQLAGPPSAAQASELERFFHPAPPAPVPPPRSGLPSSGLLDLLSGLLPPPVLR